jgi:peptidoglycan/xylan/chitin deacetylase (PgdA/CDA1 family)
MMPVLVIASGAAIWTLALSAVVHGTFIYAIIAPSALWFGPVVTHFVTDKNELWLTIDDGPDGENTLTLAQELAQRKVPATFFVIGDRLVKNLEVARAVVALGHSLANHTQTHPVKMFWALWPSRLRAEITQCSAVLEQAGVRTQHWFRAPFGLKHVRLHRLLARLGMRLVAWNIRGKDGLVCEPEKVVPRVLEQVAPGSIILLHEGHPRSLETILRVIQKLQERGYSFVIPADEQLR